MAASTYGSLLPIAVLVSLLVLSSSIAPSTAQYIAAPGPVLVLGSGGLIGSALVTWLEAHGYEVLHVYNRTHIDLRVAGALDVYSNRGVQFAFFLACEVGGSKYIERGPTNVQLDIIQHNLLIYQTVLQWLDVHKVPFVFTSSYLQSQPNAYGSVKRLGESWINNLGGRGKTVRLWNIYGHERHGIKSHVLTDWINGCLDDGNIRAQTDGTEARQFLHASDTVAALGTIMQHFNEIEEVTDISSAQWTTLRDLADLVAKHSPTGICATTWSTTHATARALIAPNTVTRLYSLWRPTLTLEQGIKLLFDQYAADRGAIAVAHDEL